MTVQKETKVLGINDAKLFELLTDTSGALAYGDAVDVPGIRRMRVSPNFIEKELKGDEAVLDTYSKLESIDWSFENAKLSLDALAILLGGEVAAGGASGEVKATGTTGSGNSAILWTSKLFGAKGNETVVVLQDPGAVSQALSFQVVGNTVIVHLATDGAGVITSTPNSIIAGITGTPAADLVTPSIPGGTGEAAVSDETVVLSGGEYPLSPRQTYTLKSDDVPAYFKLAGKADYTDAGDVHVVLYKCKATSVEYELQGEEYALVTASGKAIGTMNDKKVKDVVINETATPIN